VSLGTVSTGKSGEVVAVVPDEKDMNELYDDALHVLQTRKSRRRRRSIRVKNRRITTGMSGRSKFSFYLGSCFGADQGTQRSSFVGSIKLSPRRYDHDHECKCCDGRRERSCLRLHDIFAVLRGIACLYVVVLIFFRLNAHKSSVIRFCGSTGYIIVRMFAGE